MVWVPMTLNDLGGYFRWFETFLTTTNTSKYSSSQIEKHNVVYNFNCGIESEVLFKVTCSQVLNGNILQVVQGRDVVTAG